MSPQSSDIALQDRKKGLSLQAAHSLFNEILNDSSPDLVDSEQVCLISGKTLGSSLVCLPCGHKFDYMSLLLDQISYKSKFPLMSNKCPYCRREYSGVIPYRPDISTKRVRNINTPVDICFEKNACCYGKSGETCSINATIPIGESYACWRHYKRALKTYLSNTEPQQEVVKCQALLKSGKSKGNICGATVKDPNSQFCKRHTKP